MSQVVHPKLGAIKDAPDTRDFPIRAVMRPVQIPDAVDYEKRMTAIKDQGHRGACVSFAAAAVKEYQERKQHQRNITIDFSEEWLYKQIRQPGGGAFCRDAFKVLTHTGVPKEKYMPYDTKINDDSQETPFNPSKTGIYNASFYKAEAYARLDTIQDMCESLVINGPFMLGIDWHKCWFTPRDKFIDGYPVLINLECPIVGGHALAVVGYDLTNKVFKIRNSWGDDWGKNGYAYLAFEAAEKLGMDAWATLDLKSAKIDKEAVKTLIANKA